MSKRLVSIIMTFYNSEKFIYDSILSVLNQSYDNIELILINDGSKDNSEKIVKKFDDKRIRYVLNNENKGHTFSYNRGIKLSSGYYIAILDSDDISMTNRIKEQIEYIEEKKLDICGTKALIFGDGKNNLFPYFEEDKNIKSVFLFGNPIIHSSVLGKSEI